MNETDRKFAKMIAAEFDVSRRVLQKTAPSEDWAVMHGLPRSERVTPWPAQHEAEVAHSYHQLGRFAVYTAGFLGTAFTFRTAVLPPLMNVHMTIFDLAYRLRGNIG